MADAEAGTRSDDARASGGEYQVFLNFRGPDTRYGFIDFLYRDLVDVGIRVFRDNEKIRFGEKIDENLRSAINNSTIYIPTFSQTYASSKWCLRELVQMVKSMYESKGKKSILPIFFDVGSGDVKLKTSIYSNALMEHENQFPDEVNEWRAALTEVGEIKGWTVKSSQVEIIKSVVEEVLKKLEIKKEKLPRHFVRLDAQLKHLTEAIDISQRDVRLIAIYGMGGIGKTTMAKVIFNELYSCFGNRCSFLKEVRESLSTEDGIVRLQKRLLSNIAGSRFAQQVENSEQGMKKIGEALRTEKVLVVLDDVAEEQHIESLIGNYSLCSGSRVIITTRDKTIPPNERFNGEIRRYEMPEMDAPVALQLFSWHASDRDSPLDDYHQLSSEIVSSMGGLPLSIEVIGSSLKRRGKPVWEETLLNIKKVPKKRILKKLKYSYDDLDENEKQIFLDIACFFHNKKKTNAIYMWTSCELNPLSGVEILTERSLIKILDDDKFWMHDELIALGREIVREDSKYDLGKQSRLWIAEEALDILKTEEKKDKVKALDIDGLDDSIEITNQEFERLRNLRFLKLCNGTYVGDFAKCRSNLRWISWRCPRQRFRAKNLHLDHLVVFELGANGFTDDSKAWDLMKMGQNLRVISLTECDGITTIPDFSKCVRLERLTVAHCNKLRRIKSFIGNLPSLIELNIEWCKGLTDLPEEVGALVKLSHLSLQGCCKLSKLPGSLGNLTSLIGLNLLNTCITRSDSQSTKLPPSLTYLQTSQVRYLLPYIQWMACVHGFENWFVLISV
ncbi:disease resistance protein L6-like [Rhodamnia argentea]|uniref:Disease resistance protein L6-like n=1 Tax=Rhodamnia argentea TaxID=178133 RepID=A0ABM3H3M9_9MYRT|nr:disease resistance protein L6-like [Rhodamnia argentea]